MDLLLETKLESLQKHAEELQSVIDELMPYKEMADDLLKRNQELSYLEFDSKCLKALEYPDPEFAIKMIRKGQDAYMYTCKTLEDKSKLFSLALASNNPDVVLTVTIFLYFSLNTNHFGELVMNNEIAATQFLHNYLLGRSFEEFKLVCQRYNRTRDLKRELLKRNPTDENLQNYFDKY